MSTSDLSYEETGKLIKLIEDHYFGTLTGITRIEFDTLRKKKTKFRKDTLGKYFGSLNEVEDDYLRSILYQRYNKMGKNSTLLFHPTQTFLDGIDKFFGRDVISDIKGIRKQPIGDKITIFNNSSWVYYYYDEQSSVAGISTGFLHIGDNPQSVRIKDKYHESGDDLRYTGDVELISNNRLLLFELHTEDTGERDLHILVHIGSGGSLPKVAMGQYHNVDDSMTIISGTIILELADKKHTYDSFTPTFFEKGTQPYRNLKKEVKKYLGDKACNRIKVRAGNLSYEQLGKWIYNKRVSTKSNVPKGKVRTFISAPITSLSTKNFDEFKSSVSLIKESLESHCLCDCYCALLNVKSQTDLPDNLLFKEILDELQQCQLFVMVLPPYLLDRQTSALIEFGIIYNRRIPILIFEPKDQSIRHLPNLLRGAGKISHNFINCIEYTSLENIPEQFKKHGRKLFGL